MAQAGFVHSTPVPRIYKIASKVAKNVKEGKDSLKNLVYAEKHVNIKALYALVVEAFRRNEIIDDLIEKSELLVKEPRFNVWLAKILISELLWGKNKMTRGSKPIETILSYEGILKTLLKDCVGSEQPILKHNIAKPRYVRVNTLKITLEEAVTNFKQEGWIFIPFFNKTDYEGFQNRLNLLKPDEFMKDIHIPELLIFPPKTEFYQHEAYKTGNIILQDKASCLPVHLLAPPPGSTVLDTCAAPGMKTTQLAAHLQNKGTVYAVELNLRREALLKELVESVGATCIKTILKDVMQVSADDCPDVEYILVDPSCSGSGITDRVEIEKLDLSTKMERLRKLCNFQAKLLRHTMTAFPKAKRIVYSTCSINAEENEDVVRQTLETSRQFKLIDAKKLLQSWNTKTSELYPELGNMCIYATPEEDKTNGFFVAVFERLEDGEKNPYLNFELCKFFDKETRKNKSHDNIQQTDEFLMNTKNGSNGNLISSNNYQKEQNKNICDGKKKTRQFLEDSSFNITKNKKNKRKISVDEGSLVVNESNSNSILPEEKKNKKKVTKLNEENKMNLENSVEIGHVPIKKQKKCKTANAEESENTELYTDKLIDKKKIKQKNKHVKETKELESLPHDEKNDHIEEDSVGVSFRVTKEKKKHKKLKRNSSNENMESEIVTEESINTGFDIVPPKEKKKKKDKKISNEDNGPENSYNSIQVDENKQKKSKKETDKAGSLNNFDQVEKEVISELDENSEIKIKRKKKKKLADNETVPSRHDSSEQVDENKQKKAKKETDEAKSLSNFDQVEKEVISELEGNNEFKIKRKKKKKLTDDNETVPSRHESSELSQEVTKIKRGKHSFESDVEIDSQEKNIISEIQEELYEKEITRMKRKKRRSDNLEDNGDHGIK